MLQCISWFQIKKQILQQGSVGPIQFESDYRSPAACVRVTLCLLSRFLMQPLCSSSRKSCMQDLNLAGCLMRVEERQRSILSLLSCSRASSLIRLLARQIYSVEKDRQISSNPNSRTSSAPNAYSFCSLKMKQSAFLLSLALLRKASHSLAWMRVMLLDREVTSGGTSTCFIAFIRCFWQLWYGLALILRLLPFSSKGTIISFFFTTTAFLSLSRLPHPLPSPSALSSTPLGGWRVSCQWWIYCQTSWSSEWCSLRERWKSKECTLSRRGNIHISSTSSPYSIQLKLSRSTNNAYLNNYISFS